MGHATPGATPPVPPARIPASNNGPAKGNTPMSSPYSSTQAALACRAFCARISRLLDILVSIPVTVLLVSLVAIVGYSVITRYIFSNPPAWTEEVSLFMIVATVFICLRVTFKRGQQIGVTILVDKFPKLAFVFTVFSYLMSILFLSIVTKQSFQGANFFAVYKAPSTGLSFYWLYMSMAVGCGLSTLEVFLMLVQRCCTALLPADAITPERKEL